MSFYAIQRKGGGLLPQSRNRNNTHVEVGDYGPPRLFLSARAARNALNCWLKGIWYRDSDGEIHEPNLNDRHNRRKNRDPDLYEVVEIVLFVKGIPDGNGK
jgi:hypothetical protein